MKCSEAHSLDGSNHTCSVRYWPVYHMPNPDRRTKINLSFEDAVRRIVGGPTTNQYREGGEDVLPPNRSTNLTPSQCDQPDEEDPRTVRRQKDLDD